jgi:hypothetical protein
VIDNLDSLLVMLLALIIYRSIFFFFVLFFYKLIILFLLITNNLLLVVLVVPDYLVMWIVLSLHVLIVFKPKSLPVPDIILHYWRPQGTDQLRLLKDGHGCRDPRVLYLVKACVLTTTPEDGVCS